MKLIYLACPYTHPNESIRMIRKGHADRYAAKLAMTRELAVFSPITHGCRLEPHLPAWMAQDHSFWMDQCYPVLRKCDALYLLPLEGWRESKGVAMELAFAQTALIPIIVVQNVCKDTALETLNKKGLESVGWADVHWINGEPA